jgi:glycosyltransferase involved in cell wall biosynthesis
MGIQKDVIFTGKILHEHTPSYLKACDILVLPLKKIYEEHFHAAPIKLFEYMAAQKPIISTDMPSIRQFVHNSIIFVPPGRADMWAESLIALASNPKDREKKGMEAFAHLEKCGYTWDENARKIFRFCDEILQNRGTAELKCLPIITTGNLKRKTR